jgi:hypothetical protein
MKPFPWAGRDLQPGQIELGLSRIRLRSEPQDDQLRDASSIVIDVEKLEATESLLERAKCS